MATWKRRTVVAAMLAVVAVAAVTGIAPTGTVGHLAQDAANGPGHSTWN